MPLLTQEEQQIAHKETYHVDKFDTVVKENFFSEGLKKIDGGLPDELVFTKKVEKMEEKSIKPYFKPVLSRLDGRITSRLPVNLPVPGIFTQRVDLGSVESEMHAEDFATTLLAVRSEPIRLAALKYNEHLIQQGMHVSHKPLLFIEGFSKTNLLFGVEHKFDRVSSRVLTTFSVNLTKSNDEIANKIMIKINELERKLSKNLHSVFTASFTISMTYLHLCAYQMTEMPFVAKDGIGVFPELRIARTCYINEVGLDNNEIKEIKAKLIKLPAHPLCFENELSRFTNYKALRELGMKTFKEEDATVNYNERYMNTLFEAYTAKTEEDQKKAMEKLQKDLLVVVVYGLVYDNKSKTIRRKNIEKCAIKDCDGCLDCTIINRDYFFEKEISEMKERFKD